MSGRHAGPPLGGQARDATAPPHHGRHRAPDPVAEVGAMFDDLKRKTDAYWALVDARQAAEAAFAPVHDPRCLCAACEVGPGRCPSCGHPEDVDCGCSCCPGYDADHQEVPDGD